MHLDRQHLLIIVLFFLGHHSTSRRLIFLEASGPPDARANVEGTRAQGPIIAQPASPHSEGSAAAASAQAPGEPRRHSGRIRRKSRADSNFEAPRNYTLDFDELQPCAPFDCDTGPLLPNYAACGLKPPALEQFKNASIVFYHLPKVGGSSIENILIRYSNRANSRLLSFFRPPSHSDLHAISTSPRHATLMAKRNAGLESLTPPPTATLCAFRHPVTRILSVYNYCRHNVRAPGHALSHRYAFSDWYYRFRGLLADISNSEVRFLLARSDDRQVYDTAEPSAIFGIHEFELLNTTAFHLPPVTPLHLQIAKWRIAKLSWVGITERLQEGLSLLSRMLNVPLDRVNTYMCGDRPCPRRRAVGSSVVENATPHPLTDVSVLTPQLRKDIEVDNWASMELYKYAWGLYRSQMAHLGGPAC
eukprot:jgi/Mesvir1/11903/Mv00247-RA.1